MNILTYLDMTARGRPASEVPARAAQRMAEGAGIDLTAGRNDGAGDNRAEGLGALLGYGAGLGSGLLFAGLGDRLEGRPVAVQAGALTLVAMLAGNLPAAAMGITDPRRWSASDWMADVIPHAFFGTVTALAYRAVRR